MIVLFNKTIVKLDEYERSVETDIRKLKTRLALVTEARKRKEMCIRDRLYNELVKKEKMSKEEKSQKKKLAKQLAACRTEQGLSKASLEHYIKVCGKQFSKLLSSQQVQAEADRVDVYKRQPCT